MFSKTDKYEVLNMLELEVKLLDLAAGTMCKWQNDQAKMSEM